MFFVTLTFTALSLNAQANGRGFNLQLCTSGGADHALSTAKNMTAEQVADWEEGKLPLATAGLNFLSGVTQAQFDAAGKARLLFDSIRMNQINSAAYGYIARAGNQPVTITTAMIPTIWRTMSRQGTLISRLKTAGSQTYYSLLMDTFGNITGYGTETRDAYSINGTIVENEFIIKTPYGEGDMGSALCGNPDYDNKFVQRPSANPVPMPQQGNQLQAQLAPGQPAIQYNTQQTQTTFAPSTPAPNNTVWVRQGQQQQVVQTTGSSCGCGATNQTTQQIACTTCGSAVPAQDLAYMEKQMSNQTALQQGILGQEQKQTNLMKGMVAVQTIDAVANLFSAGVNGYRTFKPRNNYYGNYGGYGGYNNGTGGIVYNGDGSVAGYGGGGGIVYNGTGH